jgi:coproporphyrinogen III oxidase-like Fe-S oxidoreductase
VYWTAQDPYYAFGLGAASYVDGVRFNRPSKLGKYYQWVEGLVNQEVGGVSEQAETEEDALLNTVMLRLRTADGLDTRSFASRFGDEAASTVLCSLQKHISSGMVLRTDDHRLRLSDPRGFLLSNVIISDVFAAFKF